MNFGCVEAVDVNAVAAKAVRYFLFVMCVCVCVCVLGIKVPDTCVYLNNGTFGHLNDVHKFLFDRANMKHKKQPAAANSVKNSMRASESNE